VGSNPTDLTTLKEMNSRTRLVFEPVISKGRGGWARRPNQPNVGSGADPRKPALVVRNHFDSESRGRIGPRAKLDSMKGQLVSGSNPL